MSDKKLSPKSQIVYDRAEIILKSAGLNAEERSTASIIRLEAIADDAPDEWEQEQWFTQTLTELDRIEGVMHPLDRVEVVIEVTGACKGDELYVATHLEAMLQGLHDAGGLIDQANWTARPMDWSRIKLTIGTKVTGLGGKK